MTEEPSTAAADAESLSLPGRGHRESGEHLTQVFSILMYTQKTHLQTSPSAAPSIMAEKEGVGNRALRLTGRQGRGQQGQEWTQKLLVSEAELLSFLLLFGYFFPTFSKAVFEKREHKSAQNEAWSTASHTAPVLQWRNGWQGPMGCSWVQSQRLSLLAQTLVAHGSPGPRRSREETQCITSPSQNQLTSLGIHLHLSYLGRLSHHSQPPSHFSKV